MKNDSNWRYNFVGVVLFILPVMIVLQIVRIKFNPPLVEDLISEGKNLSGEYRIMSPARGKIYDRWGHILASNKKTYEVGVDLYRVRNPETIAQTLNLVLGLDYADVLKSASVKPSESSVYVVLADNIDEEKIKQLEILIDQMWETYRTSGDSNTPSLSGLIYKPHLMRTYPEKVIASNILGFVSREGKGFFGVEEKYHDLLAGNKETLWISLDPHKVQEIPEIPEGASLVLTLDREVQRTMENVLDEALLTSGADSGTLVVMDPKTGEILAIATVPRLDLNEYWEYGKLFTEETPFNRGVSQAYEPGSVYKVFTMAAALDNGTVIPETTFIDTGVFEIGGTRIYNWNSGAWGPQDMQGCMQHSLNVCLAWVASQLGSNDFYRYMEAFGIGRLTGVDLAGEVSGRLKVPGDEDWYETDLGTNAFGQGVAATPIQMATGISAIANKGVMMAPHVVRSVINDGYQHNIENRVLGIPIRPETAEILTELLARSLETESSAALVPGYRVAGKTGTAEIPTPYGYTTNATNASFVGWGPVDDPHFLIYIWLERPKTSPWGSVVAAPVFKQAAEELVVLMNLPPDEIRLQLSGQ